MRRNIGSLNYMILFRKRTHVVLILTLLSWVSIAQPRPLKGSMYKDLRPSNSITESYGDSTVTFSLQPTDQDFKTDLSKRYYWFHQGELKSTVGSYAGKLLNGPYERYDRNGNLQEKGYFEHGLKTGTWLTWYSTGSLAGKYHWRKGQHHDVYEEYFPDGKTMSTGSYKHGKLNGKILRYAADGSMITTLKYRKGVLVKEKVKEKRVRKVKVDSTNAKSVKKKLLKEKKPKDKSKTKDVKASNPNTSPAQTQPVTTPAESKARKKKKATDNQQAAQPLQQTPVTTPVAPPAKKEKKRKKDNQSTSGQPSQSESR